LKEVFIYSDGGSAPNPGPGGYGVVMKYKQHRKELFGGFRKTTNNRMEITGAIRGLEELTERCRVTLRTDSQYVVNPIEKGWARKWRSNNWMRNKKEAAINPDLWAILLELCDKHDVTFEWVKGHAGDPDNERCDALCAEGRAIPELPVDEGYERNTEACELF